MLPVMSFSLIYVVLSYLIFLRNSQHIIDEIWLDKAGQEVRLVYRNKAHRESRGKTEDEIIVASSLTIPPVEESTLKGKQSVNIGPLFPNEYPLDELKLFHKFFFWKKYYLSKRKYFLIPKE